jgi:hypothetical protein
MGTGGRKAEGIRKEKLRRSEDEKISTTGHGAREETISTVLTFLRFLISYFSRRLTSSAKR